MLLFQRCTHGQNLTPFIATLHTFIPTGTLEIAQRGWSNSAHGKVVFWAGRWCMLEVGGQQDEARDPARWVRSLDFFSHLLICRPFKQACSHLCVSFHSHFLSLCVSMHYLLRVCFFTDLLVIRPIKYNKIKTIEPGLNRY